MHFMLIPSGQPETGNNCLDIKKMAIHLRTANGGVHMLTITQNASSEAVIERLIECLPSEGLSYETFEYRITQEYVENTLLKDLMSEFQQWFKDWRQPNQARHNEKKIYIVDLSKIKNKDVLTSYLFWMNMNAHLVSSCLGGPVLAILSEPSNESEKHEESESGVDSQRRLLMALQDKFSGQIQQAGGKRNNYF